MTLRANITTTYRETNASPPRATKNVQKEAADQGVHESEGTRNPAKPATKAPDQGAVPLTEHGGDRSAIRNSGQTSAAVDAFERSSPNNKSAAVQGAGPDITASDSRPDTSEREVTSGPAVAAYGPDLREPNVEESAVNQKHSATVADRSSSERFRSMAKEAPPYGLTKTDKVQEISSSGTSEAPESPSQSLPVATPPKIHLAESFARAAIGNAVANSSTVDSEPASVSAEKSDPSSIGLVSGLVSDSSDEGTMQRELTAALQFGQAQGDNSQTDSATGSNVAKHLQSEGVFGISPRGRNLGTLDFIRQKQFEYTMDQKPFTTDDLLLETEKAIHGTLDSDQSSAVSKSLLQAAESINAYRNQSVKSSERAEVAASVRGVKT